MRCVQHVALLRGITPSNPQMRNALLVGVLAELGLHDVTSVISSGNFVFDTDERDRPELEGRIEQALQEHLGAPCTAIVRSRRQLDGLLRADPFHGHDDDPTARCNVTFLQHRPARTGPRPAEGDGYEVLGVHHGAVFFLVDSTRPNTPAVMTALERVYGSRITTRTWRTVHRISRAFERAR